MGYKTYTCSLDRHCGDCEWLAIPYPIQLKRKQASLEESFTSTLQESSGTLASIVGMDTLIHYRVDIPVNYSLRDFGVIPVLIDMNLLRCCHNTSTQLPVCWLLLVCNVCGSVDVCTHQDAIFGFAIGHLRCTCLREGVLTCQRACIRSPPIQDALDV